MFSQLSSHASELRQQGAEEAARDPNNHVTSEDAEHFMVDETKKAGIPAYQFDPYASPEEKAAQARSVSELKYLLASCALLKDTLLACAGRLSSREAAKRRCNCYRHCGYSSIPCIHYVNY